ncbi:Avirulence (Avh) protein [Phytophthora megakarya]|uniref:Avirulence (Avh) protein n=1 Tax=Phytophthora megakarya TaxID=4795 RepID=A0A225VCC0_9STRA|nr:Avirulence (Avh) protein [Phytophthora megakarya]
MFSFSKHTPEKLRDWLAKEKFMDTVFTRLHLFKAGKYLFYEPEFVTWVKYADDLSIKNPKNRLAAISTLTAQYGDDTLYQMLELATYSSSMKDIAVKLQSQQRQYWISTRKDPDEFFHLLGLDAARDRLFNFHNFSFWTKHVDNINAKFPEEPVSMLTTLHKYYTDKDFFKMIEAAKKNERTEPIATRLEAEQFQSWLQSKTSPDKVMINLGLGHATHTLLAAPLFDIWIRYINAYSAKFPDKMKMMEEHTQAFGDVGVTMILPAMKSTEMTASLAIDLASVQQKMWLTRGKSTDDVFKLHKLDKTENIL